jgi:hypothetical protein
MGALILAVPVPVAFGLVGALTLATVPALRPVKRLDPLLARREEAGRASDRLVSYPISE